MYPPRKRRHKITTKQGITRCKRQDSPAWTRQWTKRKRTDKKEMQRKKEHARKRKDEPNQSSNHRNRGLQVTFLEPACIFMLRTATTTAVCLIYNACTVLPMLPLSAPTALTRMEIVQTCKSFRLTSVAFKQLRCLFLQPPKVVLMFCSQTAPLSFLSSLWHRRASFVHTKHALLFSWIPSSNLRQPFYTFLRQLCCCLFFQPTTPPFTTTVCAQVPFCFPRGFPLLSGMLLSHQRWSSCCSLSDGKAQ